MKDSSTATTLSGKSRIYDGPPHDCPLCPRLVAFRKENREKYPDKHNAPVPSFGALSAELLVVGLAPGLKGANFTGRPFTGDYAGDLLYSTLKDFGLAEGSYEARPDDSLTLKNCRITNAVRCVPPGNKPTLTEKNNCRPFLKNEIAAMDNLKVIVALGTIAHKAVLKTFDMTLSHNKFGHGEEHDVGDLTLIDSYHCSRYNTQTGRLTEDRFHEVFSRAKQILDKA